MANEEHLRIIRQGVSKWNSWRANSALIRPDLSKADLSGIDLNNADLHGVDLHGADLTAADLTAVNLSEANLSEAELTSADLTWASLIGTNLTKAELYWTNFTDADLNGADLRAAHIQRANFGGSNLAGAKGLEGCEHEGPSILDYSALAISGMLPVPFLRGCGLPDNLIEYLPSLLNQPLQFYSCFISYSHADKAFAKRLYDSLQGRGIRCWLDEKQLLPGDDIHDQIDRGIKLWDKVLLCCSKHSLTSLWVDGEIERAFQKEQLLRKERSQKVLALIPLNLDGYLLDGWQDGKASQVRARLAPDFRGWDTDHARWEELIEQLVRALRADEHAREKPPQSRL
jgi:uncharacterized protein YjbI with pentapeptide repeats